MQFKERFRLADEEAHGRQKLHYAHGNAFGLSRSNDRAWRETPAQERTRHDEVRLDSLALKRRSIQIGKHQSIRGVG
jgi:hypothetical protein